jgi:hypothetical protein
MGLFGWLRDQGFTTARAPARAKREIHAALSARRLTGSAETVGAGFLVALDTWFHLAAPELRRRAERSAARGNSNAFAPSEDDAKRRDEAIGLLRSLSIERFSELVEEIVTVDVERAGQVGASGQQQEARRRRWLEPLELLQAMSELLERQLRAPLGVPFPRTLKEWNGFERALIERLRSNGLSYGEISRICRPGASPPGRAGRKARVERERIRGSVRRARAHRP